MNRFRRLVLLLIVGISLAVEAPAHAVILYAKRLRNTSAPNGALANSGWQWEGKWGAFLGTPISKNYFITAEHINGAVGDPFLFNGRRYYTTATYDDPSSDLQIYHIQGRFDTWAPLLSDYSDINKTAVIFGRGTQRGPAVVLNDELKGWEWGASDNLQSWGTNLINASSTGETDNHRKIKGTRLNWSFDRNGQPQESAISAGDSGGGVFIQSAGQWKLAGINFSTQAEFSYPDSDDVLSGALFDAGGLKVGDNIITDTAADIPALSYATRISPRAGWIADVLAGRVVPSATAMSGTGVPEPGTASIATIGVMMVLLQRRRSTPR